MTEAAITSYDVTPRQAVRMINICLRAGLVPYLEGSPGAGKSALAAIIQNSWNLAMIDHRLSTSQPEDLSGLPFRNERGYSEFSPFEGLFPLEDSVIPEGKSGWMIFLDELPSAGRDVIAASYKLILDRMVGQRKLHRNVVIMAAGNLATDRAIVNAMGTAMGSRLIHFKLKVDKDEWLEDVALPQNYDSRIVAFLSQFPSKLMNFNPVSTDKTFGCPRTWEFLNKQLRAMAAMKIPMDADLTPMVAGTIGPALGTEFVSYCEHFKKLPDIKAVLSNPNAAVVPHEASLRWAMTTVMCEHLSKETLPALATYIKKFDASFQILFLRMLNLRFPKLHGEPAYLDLAAALSSYLTPKK